ncbi:hypothetical protein FA13DRAFT_1871249 [Coprinellus micaceus]|uniref:Uncharacterized protein n=1 Tax=Coprinellus micaceus TaxID=71717 RepID=A0A4Y7T519_COPMI|nr:hypothetical protein FA13DRAFT_1871249 [Coprinellus micaceus]
MSYRYGRTEDSPFQDGALIPPVGTQDSPLPSGWFLNTLSRSAVAGAPTPPPPTSPREQIFGNRDTITLIFQQFLPPTTGVPDKATRAFLRQLALLCRSFSEPALDCLWNRLDSTVPLIRLLEPSAVVVNGTYVSYPIL